MAQPHISVAAETLFSFNSFPITNSLLSTWIVMVVLVGFSFFMSKRIKKRPDRFQTLVEIVVGGIYNFFRKLGGKHGDKFAPLVTTFFFFIVASNWFGLLPGVGTIGIFEKTDKYHTEKAGIVEKVNAEESRAILEDRHLEFPQNADIDNDHSVSEKGIGKDSQYEGKKDAHHGPKFIPLFRGPTADLNTTIGLGIIAFFAIQYFGITLTGFSYLKRFLDLRSPIYLFVGILEAVSDLSKILSFGFRLFGNIFAGEVLLAIMAFLFAFLLPIPFYGLEIFVGVVQGLVFSMLTTVFINIAVAHGEHVSGSHHEAHHGA
ncbi:MAG: F0F1 ATP synthase subunit A [Patescibacteria group bacterium]|nr:F0F1 ATP synthase subunit A [Patescibacteria group bacterium]